MKTYIQSALDYAYDKLERQERDRQEDFDKSIQNALEQRGIIFDPENHAQYFKQYDLEVERQQNLGLPMKNTAITDEIPVRTKEKEEEERES